MHGKSCFSIAVYENHVKMQAADPFAIEMILPVRKNAWKIVFFNIATRKPRKNAGPRAVPQTPLGDWSGVLRGSSGGRLGQFWDSKTTPRDFKMTKKRFPKQQKSNERNPNKQKQRLERPTVEWFWTKQAPNQPKIIQKSTNDARWLTFGRF